MDIHIYIFFNYNNTSTSLVQVFVRYKWTLRIKMLRWRDINIDVTSLQRLLSNVREHWFPKACRHILTIVLIQAMITMWRRLLRDVIIIQDTINFTMIWVSPWVDKIIPIFSEYISLLIFHRRNGRNCLTGWLTGLEKLEKQSFLKKGLEKLEKDIFLLVPGWKNWKKFFDFLSCSRSCLFTFQGWYFFKYIFKPV